MPSGSPVALVLRPIADPATIKTVTASLALAKRGMTMLRAKRAIESTIEHGETTVQVPMVESVPALAADLRDAGVAASRLATEGVNVRALRESLGMTQEQFARRYNLDVAALRNWEQERRSPDGAALSYLRVIAAYPEEAARAQEAVSPHAPEGGIARSVRNAEASRRRRPSR